MWKQFLLSMMIALLVGPVSLAFIKIFKKIKVISTKYNKGGSSKLMRSWIKHLVKHWIERLESVFYEINKFNY